MAEWTAEYVNDLNDSSFAYVEPSGKKDGQGKTIPRSLRHFPYKDADGSIDLAHLRNALARAPQSAFSKQAMPKLEAAAKTMKIGKYAEQDKITGDFCLSYSIFEEEFKPNEEKKEVSLTFMREGWGNKVDNNFYTKNALDGLVSLLKARKKMYLNHPVKENEGRSIKDWAAGIQDVWVEERAGVPMVRGKVKVYDNWLWERMKDAPDEIAVSINGRGEGSKKKIGEKLGNMIERISWVNSADFVDYPGNAPMGVTFVENFKQGGNIEMDIKDLTIAEIKESRQDIIEALKKEFTPEVKPAADNSKIEAAVTEMEGRLTKAEKANELLVKENDQLKIKEAIRERKALVNSLISESGIERIAVTKVFLGLLESAVAEKDKAIEETLKAMIAEQKKIVEDARGQKPTSELKNDKVNIGEADKIAYLRKQGHTDQQIEENNPGLKCSK